MIGFNPCPVSPAGQIDQQLDTAYDAVKEVRDNIDKIQYLYDLLKNENRLNVITYKDPDFVITGNHNNHLIINESVVDNTYYLGSTDVTVDGVTTSGVGAHVLITPKTDSKIIFEPLDGITILTKSGAVLSVERTNDMIGFIAVSPTSWLMLNDDTAKTILAQLIGDLTKLIKDTVLLELKTLGYDKLPDGRIDTVNDILNVIDAFGNKGEIKETKFAIEKEGQIRVGQVIELNARNKAMLTQLLQVEADGKGNTSAISEVSAQVNNPRTGLSAAFGFSQKALTTAEGLVESTSRIDNSLKDVINNVVATALFIQSVSNKLDGTVNSLLELSGKVIDGRTGLEATRIFSQSTRTLVDGAIESITLLENKSARADANIQAVSQLAMNTKVTADGVALANLTLNNRVTSLDRNLEATASLVQSVIIDADGLAQALSNLGVKVTSIDEDLVATTALAQSAKNTADGAVEANNNLTAEVRDSTKGLEATNTLAQLAKTTADGAVTSITTLSNKVNDATKGLEATNTLAQTAKTVADGAVTANTTLSNKVNDSIKGLDATNTLAQTAKTTADGAVTSITTLSGTVNNAVTGLSATYTIASQAKATADGAAQSVTNINSSITNINNNLTATANLAQSAKNTADGAISANNTLTSTVNGINGRLGTAELSLSSTINSLGVVSSRAYLKTSNTSNGATTVTSISVGGSDNDIRFVGKGIKFTDLNGVDQMSYDPVRGAWMWGGDMIAGTFQTALSGIRAEMSGKGYMPLWYGSGDKTWANAWFAVDTSGNVKIRGQVYATTGILNDVTINNDCTVLGTIYADQIVTPGTNSFSWVGVAKNLNISNTHWGTVTIKYAVSITRKRDRNNAYMPFTAHISGFGGVQFVANGYGYAELNNYVFTVTQKVYLEGTELINEVIHLSGFQGHGGGTINHTAVLPDVSVDSTSVALSNETVTIIVEFIVNHINGYGHTYKGGSIKYNAPRLLCTTYEKKGGISATNY